MITFNYLENKRMLLISSDHSITNNSKIIESSSHPVQFKDSIALISPYEWECQGEVYLIKTNEGFELLKLPIPLMDDESIKAIAWVDEFNLLLIIGSLWGTVNIGGDLYSFNIKNNERKLLKTFPLDIQVTDISIEDRNITLKGIKYTDKEFNHSMVFIDNVII
ncbi:hypothetical protein PAECIP112173_04693 [Paenibacillus sp. JJ-100]|uniref:DUF4652 domain-containing protein n=1 Tax=Paenibacillus sp. JJ-100 TaxID=2974896 RepID=UPI0022FF9EBE|nr:DUF4652 domain-containing protein [Paenibacillus sp. JJ-100]CAI6085590.1 hypothetical protein PAECIP112173_04693 [Paenibacillus sp. JJ-100]